MHFRAERKHSDLCSVILLAGVVETCDETCFLASFLASNLIGKLLLVVVIKLLHFIVSVADVVAGRMVIIESCIAYLTLRQITERSANDSHGGLQLG